MIDTKIMEYTAEDLISHKLLRFKFLVAKPKFDQEGADLLVFNKFRDGAKFIRVQCKGRSVIKESQYIHIPCAYLEGNRNGLLVTLFVEDGKYDNTNLFCFFPDQIKEWKKTDDKKTKQNYRLHIKKDNFKEMFKNNIFDDGKKNTITELIETTNFEEEFKFSFPLVSSGAPTNVTMTYNKNSNITTQSQENPTFKSARSIQTTLGDQTNRKINPVTGDSEIDKQEL